MKDWELSYIAGLVDGEAHIGIQREMSARRKTPAYVLRFEIGMTDREPLDFINSLLFSAKIIKQASKGRRLAYYRFRLCHQEALALLKSILPYLQAKRKQVEICIKLDELRQSYTPEKRHTGMPKFQAMPPEFVQQAEKLYWELRSLHLNKKPRDKRAIEHFI